MSTPTQTDIVLDRCKQDLDYVLNGLVVQAAIREAEQRGNLAGRIAELEEAAKICDTIAPGCESVKCQEATANTGDIVAEAIRARIAELRKEVDE